MFYGSLQDNKLDRPNRKYYSADGSMEIKITPAGTEFVTYLGGDGYSAPVVYKKTYSTAGNAQEQMLYLHRDYQGSILAITNDVGAVVEKRQFDAWGSLINYYNATGAPFGGWGAFDRGYTGHEHLQSLGLIHMNGRLYDPKLHRFLQPDNFVQDTSDTQNFNRYSYVLNNPLKYTDPSGELKINWNDIAAGAAIVVGTVLSATGFAAVGIPLIGAGLAHFGAAYAEYTRTGDWNAASNNAGFSFGYSQRVDWFDGKSNKSDVNGITQNAPVVTPKTVDDVKKDKGEDSFSNMVSNTYGANDIYNFYGNKIMINSENGSNNWSFLGTIHTSKRFYDGYKRDGINSYSGLLLMHEYGHWLHSQYHSLNWYSYGMWSSMATANSATASSNWTEIKANTMSYYYFGMPTIFNHPVYKKHYPIDTNSISDELKYKLYHHLKP
jgi:RHS repeat-associated protein